MTTGELLTWLRSKLADAQKAVMFRVQSAETWRGGTEEHWRQGTPKGMKTVPKSERMKLAATADRIAARRRIDVAAYERLIEIVESGVPK